MAEQLGRDYVMSIKPNPTYLAQARMEEHAARRELKDALEVSRGCWVELVMKDNHTHGGNPENASRWVEIAREEIARLG